MTLEITGLQAGYRSGVAVVHDVGLSVSGGSAVGIIGRNGAGKTCLAQTVHGVLPTQVGTIVLDGVEVQGLSVRQRVRRGLALVPEGRMIFAQLSVRENLEMAAYGANKPLGRAELDRVCEIFPLLRTKLDDRAGTMSGGEQQWLALGRALVQQPSTIVLDEPSLGLSPVAITGLGESLAVIRDQGVAIVLMEQNPHLLERLCNTVLLLDKGTFVRELDLVASGRDVIEQAYLGA
ncbi:ATP-binding cassette domain-containing protein [Nocardioides pantholopis]|uniref:ATP-binding cassette domain-containing protein n=1 Tax=Nocardioides pantholopis TaxID=2483798 RepID=UPI000FD9A836|nr:ATP-binding cassette domain-containing protein [Nocardioides pantholopis]